ncbi:MAG TPA: amidohydrolase family protein [Buttiauxella sp.]|uniref:amidohydrolase family protein n=1 Tax=Buttiauxella sp. TaxID=1972222 RepID=UPI002B47D936|nr:amidohydrolase family protein [Buttiauxella sp.]HKM98662.1 amidohydrolase family protein [Buttiauxella sp.]
MKCFDSHLHLWDPRVLRYDWLSDLPALNQPFLPEVLATEAQAPDAAIVVQADCAEEQAVDEVNWINQLAEYSPIHIAGIVAWAALEKGNAVIPHLHQLRNIPRVVGIRRSLQNEPEHLFYDMNFRAGLLAAARNGFVLDLCVRASQLQGVYDLLYWLFSHAPEARVVLDHMGKPTIIRNEWQAWQSVFDPLADFPQLVCKISGLPTEADWLAWNEEELQPWIQHAIAVFGPHRCLFGGDWPVVNLAGGYSRWRQCVENAISHLTPEDRCAIMVNNARDIYLSQSRGK